MTSHSEQTAFNKPFLLVEVRPVFNHLLKSLVLSLGIPVALSIDGRTISFTAAVASVRSEPEDPHHILELTGSWQEVFLKDHQIR